MAAPPTKPAEGPAHERDGAESPASVRRTFIALTALGGLLLLAPRQWVSAGMLLALSAALTLRHVVLSRREATAAGASSPSSGTASGGLP
jgi:hypothetical protein